MTAREVKAEIMKAHGWNEKQYRKQYDLFKNKLRAYESYKSAQGGSVKQQSVVDVLYKEAKAMQRYGAKYTPSRKMQQIRGFSAYSITKGRTLAKQENYQQRQATKYGEYIRGRFGTYDPNDPTKNDGFIGKNKGAQSIVDAFVAQAKASGKPVNYAKLEDALSAYADKVHAKTDEQDKIIENEAIPVSSETYGSDDVTDFDVSEYL